MSIAAEIGAEEVVAEIVGGRCLGSGFEESLGGFAVPGIGISEIGGRCSA